MSRVESLRATIEMIDAFAEDPVDRALWIRALADIRTRPEVEPGPREPSVPRLIRACMPGWLQAGPFHYWHWVRGLPEVRS